MGAIVTLKAKAPAAVDVRYVSELKIKSYDSDNLLPQNVRNIINASPTGTTCVERYAAYIEGNGVANQAIADTVVNKAGDTFDTLNAKLAQDLATFGGIAIHVNYDAEGDVADFEQIPFEMLRLCESDDSGYISQIALFDDWAGASTRNGKRYYPTAKNVKKVDVFNSRKDVVLEQIKAAGIEKYKGQILYICGKGVNVYPVPRCGVSTLTDMSTDSGISIYNNRTTRYGFFPGGIVLVPENDLAPDMDSQEDDDQYGHFVNSLEQLQGDENASKLLVMTSNGIPEPKFINFEGQNKNTEIELTGRTTVERIYAAYGQDPFYSIRIGKVGFSGTMMRDAQLYYCRMVTKEQRLLSRVYKMLCERSNNTLLRGATAADLAIEPLYQAIESEEGER